MKDSRVLSCPGPLWVVPLSALVKNAEGKEEEEGEEVLILLRAAGFVIGSLLCTTVEMTR